MKVPSWAPSDLVKLWKSWEAQERELEHQSHTNTELNAWAKREGFQRWADLRAHFEFQRGMLTRLITRPEMELFWQWLAHQGGSAPVEPKRFLYHRAYITIESWHKSPKLTTRERKDALLEAASLANKLAVVLRRFHGDELDRITWNELVPRELDAGIEYVLHPDLVQRIKPRHKMTVVLSQILPSVDEIAANIAQAAKRHANITKRVPRKVHTKGALRTYFTGEIIFALLCFAAPSPSMFSVFVSCALDDANVNEDSIRKHPVYLELLPLKGEDCAQ